METSDSVPGSAALIQQLRTPWVSNATPLAVDVIFGISCLKFIMAVLTGLIIRFCGNETKADDEDEGYEAGMLTCIDIDTDTETETINSYSTTTPWMSLVLSGIVIPLLGIFSIISDSKEVLKAYCVIIIIGFIFGIWDSDILTRFRGCFDTGCGNVRVAVCFVLLAVGFFLQVVTIAFAWRYAFYLEVTTEI